MHGKYRKHTRDGKVPAAVLTAAGFYEPSTDSAAHRQYQSFPGYLLGDFFGEAATMTVLE